MFLLWSLNNFKPTNMTQHLTKWPLNIRTTIFSALHHFLLQFVHLTVNFNSDHSTGSTLLARHNLSHFLRPFTHRLAIQWHTRGWRNKYSAHPHLSPHTLLNVPLWFWFDNQIPWAESENFECVEKSVESNQKVGMLKLFKKKNSHDSINIFFVHTGEKKGKKKVHIKNKTRPIKV